MTVTDPAGDPSLLQTVIETEHRRLAQVLREARRDTSGTPGVHEELVLHLATSLARHLNAEIALILPYVQSSLGDDLNADLAEDTRTLRRLFDDDSLAWDLDQVGVALTHHAAVIDRLLDNLRARIGGKRMANLGYEFGRAAEAAPARIPPAGRPLAFDHWPMQG